MNITTPRDAGTATSRSQTLTVMAPLARCGVGRSRLMLPVVGLLAGSSALTRLRFIHFAQWNVFHSLPGHRGGRRRPGMLFLADFDGDLREYLAAFGIATPHGMRWAFGASQGFPGPRPTRKLIAHVEAHRQEDLLRYCAYPEATVRDVDAALDVTRRLEELRAVGREGRGDRFRDCTAALVSSLARAPDQPVPSPLAGALAKLRARPTVSALAVALPLDDPSRRGIADLRRAVEACGTAVFDQIGGTHFARLSSLGDHLLLSAFVDGTPDAYVRRLVAGLGAASDMLRNVCASYPGHQDGERLASWIHLRRLPTSLFLWSRTGVTVDGIRRALACRERVMEIVTASPAAPLDDLGARLLEV